MSSVLDLFDVNEHWYNDIDYLDYLNTTGSSQWCRIISIPLNYPNAMGLSQSLWIIATLLGYLNAVEKFQCRLVVTILLE